MEIKKSQSGFSLLGVLVAMSISMILVLGLTSAAAYSVKISNTNRIDSDILAHVTTLRSELVATNKLDLTQSYNGNGWRLKRLLASPLSGGRTSYRAVYERTGSIIGPIIVNRDIGAAAIISAKREHDDD